MLQLNVIEDNYERFNTLKYERAIQQYSRCFCKKKHNFNNLNFILCTKAMSLSYITPLLMLRKWNVSLCWQ